MDQFQEAPLVRELVQERQQLLGEKVQHSLGAQCVRAYEGEHSQD